jgi:hypothetical protein
VAKRRRRAFGVPALGAQLLLDFRLPLHGARRALQVLAWNAEWRALNRSLCIYLDGALPNNANLITFISGSSHQ